MYPNQPMYGMPGFGFRNPMYQQPAVAPQQTTTIPQQMAVTPVTGMAQVEAAQVAFDGTPAYFYDTAADAVYIKQFDPRNGTSPVVVYRREQQAPPPQWATVEMLENLSRRVEEMSAMIAPKRKPAKEADEA